MKVAVPLLGNDVAPRFGEANQFLIAESHNGRVLSFTTVDIDRLGDWVFRLSELDGFGVKVTLCCGFNRYYWPLAIERGIRVITGATGDARKLVESFVHGEKLPLLPCCASPMRYRRQVQNGYCHAPSRISPKAGFGKRKD